MFSIGMISLGAIAVVTYMDLFDDIYGGDSNDIDGIDF